MSTDDYDYDEFEDDLEKDYDYDDESDEDTEDWYWLIIKKPLNCFNLEAYNQTFIQLSMIA